MRLELNTPSATQLWTMVAVGTLSWSFGPICIRYALDYDVPPTLIASGRMIVAALFFTPYAWARYKQDILKMPWRSRLLAIAAGALFAFNITLNATSLQHISVIIGQALIATIPVWVAILEATILKAKLGRAIWSGVALALAGGILISLATSTTPPALEGGNPNLGLLLALISSCSASIYIIIGRNQRSTVSFVPYIWLVYSSGALTTLLFIGLSQTPVTGYDARGYFWVLLLAILAQIIGHGVLNFALKYLSPTTLTVTAQSVPVLSVVWALVLLQESPTIMQIVGSAVLAVGVGAVLRGQTKAKTTTS